MESADSAPGGTPEDQTTLLLAKIRALQTENCALQTETRQARAMLYSWTRKTER